MSLIKVIFEPYDQQFSKVAAEYQDGSKQNVLLDNVSAKHFLRASLMKGQFQGGINLWV